MSQVAQDTGFSDLLDGEKVVKRLPKNMNSLTIDAIVNIVARETEQHVTWRMLGDDPTVITTGDTYKVLRELCHRLPTERSRPRV